MIATSSGLDHWRHLPFLGRADGQCQPVDVLDHDGQPARERRLALEVPQPGAPERAVDEHAVLAARDADAADEGVARAQPARGERLAHQHPHERAAGERDAEAGEDRHERGAAGRREQERDPGGERHDGADAERSVARHVGLRRRQRGADEHEQKAEREHVFLLHSMLLRVRARGNVIMHGRNGAP